MLAAPTGKAAKRLEQVVGHEARTIHRLLGFNGQTYRERPWRRSKPISWWWMKSRWWTSRSLYGCFRRSICEDRRGAGRRPQPVAAGGPGNVLRDLVKSSAIPTTVLTQIIRQAGVLKENSTAILDGEVRPTCDVKKARGGPWYVIDNFTDRGDVRRFLLQLFHEVLAERLGFDLVRDVQVLTPTHKGPLGTIELNIVLQRLIQKKLFGVDAPDVEPGRRPDSSAATKSSRRRTTMNSA